VICEGTQIDVMPSRPKALDRSLGGNAGVGSSRGALTIYGHVTAYGYSSPLIYPRTSCLTGRLCPASANRRKPVLASP
jgi:hypothetical protein